MAKVKPFLKWAGSKRKLVEKILPAFPKEFETYFEPFLGSGAMFFALTPKRAVLGDSLADLISTYKAVRKNVAGINNHLATLKPDSETFYQVRGNRSQDSVARAAEFIYLNKTCWNGLYRVNSQGNFNVPFGKAKSPINFSAKDLEICSKVLRQRSIRLINADFETTLSTAKEKDLVFLDPPYVTSHYKNGFHEWNSRLFTWNDQIRLADTAKTLANMGAHVVVTNADHPDIIKLYKGFSVRQYDRASTLASNGEMRRRTTEVVFSTLP